MQERQWALICHLSSLSGYFIPFGNLIVPIVIWSMKKDEYAMVDAHGKAVINFQISMTIWMLISGVLIFVIIGIPLLIILAILQEEEKETIVGVGQYGIHEQSHTAEAAFAVRDDYQGLGIGRELVSYMTYLAQRQGLLGFTAEVLQENRHMLYLFETAGFDLEKKIDDGVYYLKMAFRGTDNNE